jgi:SSS family solute:Na+ symporter
VGVMDLYKRHLMRTPLSERSLTLLAKAMTLVCGVAATLGAIGVSRFQTAILQTVASLASKFIGPITGIFVLGVLTKRANVVGVLCGALAGLTVAFLVEWAPVKEYVNWMWVAPLTCAATYVVGYLASLARPDVGASAANLADARHVVRPRGAGS